MKAVFMGTPEIAVGCLRATARWASDGCAVVTQPDRPRGRSGQPQPSAVKAVADELGLEVRQPERLRRDESFLPWLQGQRPDIVVVVAFGQILPQAVLDVPPHGCLNVHFSQLPRWRGAAPVQRAVMAGDQHTAVDTMLMDAGLDTGAVLRSARVEIGPDETAGELAQRLGELAPEVLTATLEEWTAGRLTPSPQDDSQATLAPRLSKEEAALEWTLAAAEWYNRFRGLSPWPGVTVNLAGEQVAVLEARPGEGHGTPGQLLAIEERRGILCAAGQNAIWLRRVRKPGRPVTDAAAYAHGHRLSVEGGGSG